MKDPTFPSVDAGFFYDLTPDKVLEAVEASGFRCTGRCIALNSFENRVYDVELEPTEDGVSTNPQTDSTRPYHPVLNRRIVKFYRPGRWTREQILEEHQFLADLKAAEIPVITPCFFPDGETLHQVPGTGIWYTLFPKVGGRAPDELSDDQVKRIGRLIARIHNVGAIQDAPHRMPLNPLTYGKTNLEFLLSGNWIPLEFQSRYREVVEQICKLIAPGFENVRFQRLHGDCHLGNLLWNQEGPFFLDFDDMVRGPAVQDLWLIVPGRDSESLRQRQLLVEAYEEIRNFDRPSLALIEPLRALRFIHYSAWIARRWSDQAFQNAFPQFGSHQYWSKEVDDLNDQLKIILSTPAFGGGH